MEDSITWGRLQTGLILPHFDVHDIDLHAYWYLARQPWTYRALNKLSPNTEFGRMFRHLKKTKYFEAPPVGNTLRFNALRPSTFTRRKNVKDAPLQDLADPEYPPEQSSSSSSVLPELLGGTESPQREKALGARSLPGARSQSCQRNPSYRNTLR